MAFGEASPPDYMSPPDEGGDMAAEAPVYSDEESELLAEAFPEVASDPTRLSAFKAAVSACVDRILAEREGGEEAMPMMGDKPKGGKAKAADALILAFGKPKSGAKD